MFDGSDDYHARINDPALGIDERTILVIRGSGPLGWPGSAEVVNMQPPDALLKRGIMSLPTLGDGRQSGTSDSPRSSTPRPRARRVAGSRGCAPAIASASISPRAAATCWWPTRRSRRARQEAPPPVPESATPWQELYRSTVGQLDSGGVMEMAVKYRGVGREDAAAQSLKTSVATARSERGHRIVGVEQSTGAAQQLAAEERAVVRKAMWRLLPFLVFVYFIAYLDRVNVGFAALTMNADLGALRHGVRPRRRHLLHRATSCSRCPATSR